MYEYGLIGNCQSAALINQMGSVEWMCMPRPDSPPVFGRLLDPEGGHFSIKAMGQSKGVQKYIPNTVVLETYITDERGNEFKIIDFCPRFMQHGRMYRPTALFRIVEPIKGNPTIQVSCNPVDGWSKKIVKPVRGNSHLRYELKEDSLRLITNMPMTYLCDETPFVLNETIYFGLTWSFGIEDDLPTLATHFLKQTIEYWKLWVQHCDVPTLYQEETIRSALTLKLHCYEDTGAILAALTTSLPEEFGSLRNWDYRFCWLRDAYYVLTAFHNLGHYEEMEGFIKFLLNIAEQHNHSVERLHPVYKLDATLPLPEFSHDNWAGFQGDKPVRTNNQAAEHIQNDVYGEMILTLTPIFLDERFRHLRTKSNERLMENLAQFCVQNISKPDAGLWEIRDGWKEHTFSNLMCWAGLERINRIHKKGYLKNLKFDLEKELNRAEKAVRAAIVDGALRNGPTDETLDAAMLQIVPLRFPDQKLLLETTKRIHKELRLGDKEGFSSFIYRYVRQDDFGRPASAFLICSFWLVQALMRTGQVEDAMKVMKETLSSANSLGLISEHYLPDEKRQAGNFPQAYSHVGQINAAFSISPPWSEVL